MSIVRHVIVHGRVQGVGYRMWAEDLAERLGLEGWMRNRRDGNVEAVFAGPEPAVMAAIEACRAGPRGAHVDALDVKEGDSAMLQQRPKNTRFAVLPTA